MIVLSMIHRLLPGFYFHTYGPNAPVLSIRSGDTVVATTVDAGGFDEKGVLISSDMRQSSLDTVYSSSNPLTGPVYVEGAEPGDTLSIEVLGIRLNRDSAWSRVASNFGGLTEEAPGRRLLYNEAIPAKRYEWSLDLEEMTGSVQLSDSGRFPLMVSFDSTASVYW